MIALPPGTKVFLACQPIDLRAGLKAPLSQSSKYHLDGNLRISARSFDRIDLRSL
jgi:hypothetical protein